MAEVNVPNESPIDITIIEEASNDVVVLTNESNGIVINEDIQNVTISSLKTNDVAVNQSQRADVKVSAISSNIIRIGTDGDLNFTYNQDAPSNNWIIEHNLGKFPSVSVVDSSGTFIVTDIEYVNSNKIILTFNASFSGKAYLN